MATGRQHSSLLDDIQKANPDRITFRKLGTQTVAVIAERYYNTTDRIRTIKSVHAAVNTAPTGATLVVDAQINGTSVFATAGARPAVAIAGFAASATPNATKVVLAPGEYLTVSVTQIGSTVAGSDLVVQVSVA